MIIYLSIGNSDDKLTQRSWHMYVGDVRLLVRRYARGVHGEWFSAPDAAYQNACWCIELESPAGLADLRKQVSEIRLAYGQDSAALALVAETEFI